MPEVTIDKDSDSIIFIEEDKARSQSVRKEDCVISIAEEGYRKVKLLKYNPTTGRLVVIYARS